MGYVLNRLMSSEIKVYNSSQVKLGTIPAAFDIGGQIPMSEYISLIGVPSIYIHVPYGTTCITPIGMSQSINTKLTAQVISTDQQGNISYSVHLPVTPEGDEWWLVDFTQVLDLFNNENVQEAPTNMVVIDDEP